MALIIEECKILKIGKVGLFGKNDFAKLEMLVEIGGQYPQEIPIEFCQNAVDLVNGFNVGDNVKIHFNFKGNEHNGRHFISVQGWKIEKK